MTAMRTRTISDRGHPLKRSSRTADPLPLPDGSNIMMHHQWQGEAEDEDDGIITDIIEQQQTSIDCPVSRLPKRTRVAQPTNRPSLDSTSSTSPPPPSYPHSGGSPNNEEPPLSPTGLRSFRSSCPAMRNRGLPFALVAGGVRLLVTCPAGSAAGHEDSVRKTCPLDY